MMLPFPSERFGRVVIPLREIENSASQITVQGARYPDHLEKRTGL